MLVANALLFAFNLIPAFPMDGGRILRAFLAIFLPYGRATWVAMLVGQIIAVILLLLAYPLRSFIFLFVGGLVLATGWFMRFGR
jgi:Zn-dependent protease